jgi:cell division protein FtsL
MNKEKIGLEESLSAELNKKVALNVEAQKLESYQRIVDIAEGKLGMVKNNDEIHVLEISKDKVEGILNAVNSKYE